MRERSSSGSRNPTGPSLAIRVNVERRSAESSIAARKRRARARSTSSVRGRSPSKATGPGAFRLPLREVRPFHLDHEVFLEGRRDDPDEAVSATGPCGFLAEDDLFNERQSVEPLEALVDKLAFRSWHVRNNAHSITNRQRNKAAGRRGTPPARNGSRWGRAGSPTP